jgi:hypothetical protein
MTAAVSRRVCSLKVQAGLELLAAEEQAHPHQHIHTHPPDDQENHETHVRDFVEKNRKAAMYLKLLLHAKVV